MTINSNGDIFAGTDNYLFRSTNKGDNWIQLNNGLTDLDVMTFDVRCFVFNSVGDIFIGTDTGGMYRSTDNGDSWTQNNGLTTINVWSLAINSNGDIFAGSWITDFTLSDSGVFLSTDNGDSWSRLNNGLTATNVWSLVINSNGDVFAGTDNGVFHSADNGESWTQINNGLTELDVHSLAINLEGYIYAGTGNGVFCSINTTVTAIEEAKLLPSAFTLDQNYPNPFNPSTKIKYSIPQTSKVVIKVFDLLGREVETLVNEEKSVGTYEVEFNSTVGSLQLASGVYFSRYCKS